MSGRIKGFTLIELLVVVAIIALLISILLPSLSQARAQARTTLCGTQISTITRAMMVYADDFDGRPPFIARGMENPPDYTDEYKQEDWISKDMNLMWLTDEADWPPGQCPRSGSLFPYMRFEAPYRCPEFARIPGKTQNVFNYTRNLFGRKIILPWEPGGNVYHRFLGIGNILRADEIYAPGQMFMMVDESWQFHVADSTHYQTRYIDGPRCADPIWFAFVSELGQYHSPAVTGATIHQSAEGVPVPPAIKRGALGFYDGHVDFERDRIPGRNYAELQTWLPAAIQWALQVAYAQRGVGPSPDQVETVLKLVLH